MEKRNVFIENIPVMIFGEVSEKVYLYIHGKSGCKEEAESFAQIAVLAGWQVLSIDLPEHGARKKEPAALNPWTVVPELTKVMDYTVQHWKRVGLIANSIGAWFSMLSFADRELEQCLLISPVLDMEALIHTMMGWAGVSEEKLKNEREISTSFGETLSWEYLEYTKQHPVVKWNFPTAILYAGKDNMTGRDTVEEFVKRFHCELAVMEEGEHWFHTPEQLRVLTQWEQKVLKIKELEIETERLIIHALTPEELALWTEDLPRLEKGLDCSYQAELMTGIFRGIVSGQVIRAKEDRSNYMWHSFWFLIRKSDRVVVGSTDFKAPPNALGEVEIGYGLGKEFEHHGYMTEAVLGMCAWAKKQQGVRNIIAETELDGLASQRVLTRCGFQEAARDTTVWWRL